MLLAKQMILLCKGFLIETYFHAEPCASLAIFPGKLCILFIDTSNNVPQRRSALRYIFPSPAPPIGMNLGSHISFMKTVSCSVCHLLLGREASPEVDTMTDKQT
jgi:hypothetical protein